MNRKLRNILWSALLFILCFPLGNIAILISKPDTPPHDYLLMDSLTGGVIFIIFALISGIVYYFAKRKNGKDPMKTALIVFSCLIIAGILGNSPKLSNAMKERHRYEFMRGLKESLYKGFEDTFKSNPTVPKEIKEHSKDISDCIYYKIKSDNSLIDELMNVNDPEIYIMNSNEMKKIVEGCMMEYMTVK